MAVTRAWTESDIVGLIGQEESLRVEFKRGALLDTTEGSWVDGISKEVSAFANTEGGVLFIGVGESKVGRIRVASEIDGVVPNIATDRLQKKIEGNVYPYLPGIGVHRVPISSLNGRVVFVIEVPQGTTAYQANDGRYYGRSALEVKHLPDHEIRVRMSRGRAARASLSLHVIKADFGHAARAEIRTKYADILAAYERDPEVALEQHAEEIMEVMLSDYQPTAIECELVIHNVGERTVREPLVEFYWPWFTDSGGRFHYSEHVTPTRHPMSDTTIYPGDYVAVPNAHFVVRIAGSERIQMNRYNCDWRVLLDDAPVVSGRIDVGRFVHDVVTRGQDFLEVMRNM